MADAGRNWIRWLVLGTLCLSAHALILAQTDPAGSLPQHFVQVESPQSGSLAGRLTDLRSSPLAGVSILLRNQSTGAEVRATTARNGAFRFASLVAGEYTLDADATRLGHGRLEGILVTGGVESRIQAALNFEPDAPVLLEATASAQIAAPPMVAAHVPLNASVPPAATQPLARLLPPQAATVAPAMPLSPLRPALSTSSRRLYRRRASQSPSAGRLWRLGRNPDFFPGRSFFACSATCLASALGALAICGLRRRCRFAHSSPRAIHATAGSTTDPRLLLAVARRARNAI
jgi:hypothetical protein